jgi:hypothetical protein
MRNIYITVIKWLVVLFIVCNCSLMAKIYSGSDSIICISKFKLAVDKNLGNEPISDVIAAIGKSFIGTEYREHTLEHEGAESLVINLSGLDCTTFLENSLAIARCIKENKTSFENFKKELIKIRYRKGVIDKYPSRLHYFSDWIFDNEKKGIIKNISKEMGGRPFKFDLNFMSSHPDNYLELKDHPEFISVIEKQEKEISRREYYFVPKEDIIELEEKIHTGDLIAITTAIKGLDINHVGIAVKMEDGRIHLLHAPNKGFKVQVTESSLADYLSKIKHDTGIIIIRALDFYKK